MPDDVNNASMFVYTEKRKVICCCGMDIEQAKTVLGILEQDRARRLECGEVLSVCLDDLQRKKKFIPDMMIGVVIKSPGGIVKEARPPIPGRVAIFVWRCCASNNELALDLLKKQLTEFIASEKPAVYRPFSDIERSVPIVIPSSDNEAKK